MLHGLEETPAWPLLRTLGQLPSRAGCCTTEGSCGKKSVLLVCAALEPSCVTADLVLPAALLGYGSVVWKGPSRGGKVLVVGRWERETSPCLSLGVG